MLLDLYDEPLDGSAGDVVHGVADILLEDLERSRDERMRDIVATIQADQYRLITREPDGVLVIQGGPGTGKTAVGLHRASWLLYTYRRELERSGVLVVGPNPVFMDYISHVLPMLGEERVEQRAVNELVDGIEAARSDPAEVARLKGDARLAKVIAAAVRALPRPAEELLAIRLEGVELRLSPEEVGGLIEDAQAESADHAAGRERLRMKLVRAFYERYTARLGNAAYHSFDDIEATLRSGGFLNRTLGALWPRPRSEQLVRRLLTSPEQLAAAADGILDEDEQRLLRSGRGRGWSEADLSLLDEARALLEGPDPARGHLIVDEAQDLTPMQLRMLARRSSGAVTVLGDIAQSSGPISYSGWDEVVRYLAPKVSPAVEELRLAYRVPAEVMELALPLLPLIAPDVAPPIAYRAGDEPPRFVRAEPRPPRRRRGARGRAGGGPRRANGPDRPGRDPRRDRAAPASPRDGVRRALLADPGADAARGQGARVRPRRAGRARPDRGRRHRGAACALRRPDTRDEDARGRTRARLAGRGEIFRSDSGRRTDPVGYQRERRPRRPE